jgi:3'(2'), 5'-bisphosphate nucleotidase
MQVLVTRDTMDAIAVLAREAGRAIMGVYDRGDLAVEYKSDHSPLTEADRVSHEIIMRGLAQIAPDVPVISEEGADVEYALRSRWKRFFLVDPLDGTKEFIGRNGEFTVNIALVERGAPVLGVVHRPVTGATYLAGAMLGAWRRAGDAQPEQIEVADAQFSALRAAASRSHGSERLEAFLSLLRVSERISAGSSLKFCLVAEGRADIYPRFGPTWEWDTAAGHAIVLEAGGRVVDTGGTEELRYNKTVLKHAGFIVASDAVLDLVRPLLVPLL